MNRRNYVQDAADSAGLPGSPLAPQDLVRLGEAVELLEHPSLVATLANIVGKPIEGGLKRLPASVQRQIAAASEKALMAAVDVATRTIPSGRGRADRLWHRVAATATGVAGGAFGLPGVAIELPLSTTIILRSVADIARAEGEDIAQLETRMACVEVFAYGSRSSSDDAAETGYLATRLALARSLTEAVRHLGHRGIVQKTAPAVLQWIAKIASRFAPAVAQKIAAQSVPIAGALGGGVVNLAFIHHFQNVAEGHFTVRRLERQYSPQAVREAYETLRQAGTTTPGAP
jgi:hypothetical protein